MGRYVVKRENFTGTAGNDVLTCISGANRRIRVIQVAVGGLHSASVAQQLSVSRSSGGTTPGGGITPSKQGNSDQPGANFTTATTWAAQPTLETNGAILGWNGLGGSIVWNAPPDGKFEARNGENISIRVPSAGVTPQPASLSVTIEED